MSEYVPIEIQEEILKRIPIKPLLQFRSVSKPWKRLIDSPDFIVSYGVRQPSDDRFILRYQDYYGYKYLCFVDNDDSFVRQEFIPTAPPNHIKETVGSSHGLLCLKGFYYDPDGFYSNYDGTDLVVVWNPSIRKSVRIRVPYVYDENFVNYGSDDVFGFGVCPVTFDPTVLKIQCIGNKRKMYMHGNGISIPWRVQVFTLSTGTWSFLSTNLPRESIRLRGSHVVIDRFIYWVAFDMLDVEDGGSQQSRFLIMSFDLTAKEFREINLTDSLTNRLCSIQTISKLRESLVLLEYHGEFEGDLSVCCLWMMKEEGVHRSFTKLYNINLLPDARINQVLGFRKTGELILETPQQYRAKLEIYDPNSKAIDNLGIEGYDHSFFMCSYMETLLLLDQLDGFIYSIS